MAAAREAKAEGVKHNCAFKTVRAKLQRVSTILQHAFVVRW